MLAKDKHSSILQKFVNYGQKGLVTLDPDRSKQLQYQTLKIIFDDQQKQNDIKKL
jgi:hypothetical protein